MKASNPRTSDPQTKSTKKLSSSIYIFDTSKILIKNFLIKLLSHSLVYVSERKIERGQNSVEFNCELFVEKFIEYCFVYVTEAKTGAVADIRMDCVPTLPTDGNLLCRMKFVAKHILMQTINQLSPSIRKQKKKKSNNSSFRHTGPVDGKWGKWSNWSECSSKFSYGTQIRYRFCDSPTPKYSGKYCEVS